MCSYSHIHCLLLIHPQQSALFGSWFSYGFPAIFWLIMNKGVWFSSPRKILLTIVNLIILGIACAIVCVHPLHLFSL